MRSINALHSRALGITRVHSEKGRFNTESGFMLSPDSNSGNRNQVEGFERRITVVAFSMAIN